MQLDHKHLDLLQSGVSQRQVNIVVLKEELYELIRLARIGLEVEETINDGRLLERLRETAEGRSTRDPVKMRPKL